MCEAYNNRGLPCRALADSLTNPPRCTIHRRRQKFTTHIVSSNGYMSRWYKKHVGPRLHNIIEEAQRESSETQLAVFEELALMREAAGQFVAIHSALVEQRENGVEVKQEAIAASAMAMQHALMQVVEVCTKATKAYEKTKAYSALDIENIVAQFTSFLWENFREDADRPKVESLLQMMEERLVLPRPGVQGTDLSVEDTAREMDSTVPFVPESE